MNYLYHRVPANMNGSTLYPLNILREVDEEIYEQQKSKYIGREHVLDQRIPTLGNCLWNDVIHLSAGHPQLVEDELQKNGESLKIKQFFQIDPNLLEVENTTVYLFNQKTENDKFDSENWLKYQPDEISKYDKIPERTARYYYVSIQKGEQPLLWAFVPHILYKGNLDVSSANIIYVK
jgi:hypothetical protein